MSRRILIDAGHPEETRVVALSGNRLEEFDYESRDNKPLKGNIYLAKVTRVEPSLQAAFVDYGGNRHGFLPFSEIHPDYYRLPVADREALMEEERAARQQRLQGEDDGTAGDGGEPDEAAQAAAEGAQRRTAQDEGDGDPRADADIEQLETANAVETLTGDEMEDAARRRAAMLGRYKIQEVIKRRQVMLVQVVKEERGTKGAALSTYLSIAGRYCVLMPNTDRGGGVSRKIASAKDRKRLKGVLAELNIPDGMSVIVRTAGADRSKVEIRRDYEHLLRQWDHIRETTLQSLAPCLIYEEANLIKRTIRDLYTREMEQVIVEGDEGYRAAKSFMRSLIPSHAKKVQKHDDPRVPLFHKHGVETQLDNIHNPAVQLQSGGYVVINQTEALVAIDVNSGKATKERHIEETALKTNLEAADEIARQLKLRDLAGLIVIDFIDMDAARNNREVEHRLKEAMKQDRARIQLGRISPFGLLELSRQRLRPSLHETSTDVCKTCGGSGFVRSQDSTALHVLRALEEEGIKRGGGEVVLTIPTQVALYVLNDKRDRLIGIEQRYGFRARIQTDDHLVPPQYRLDRIATQRAESEEESADADAGQAASGDSETDGRKRGQRGGRKRQAEPAEEAAGQQSAQASDSGEQAAQQAESGGSGEESRRRRRGKRGGQRRSKRRQEQPGETGGEAAVQAQESAGSGPELAASAPDASAEAASNPVSGDSATPAEAPAAEVETAAAEAEPVARTAPAEATGAETSTTEVATTQAPDEAAATTTEAGETEAQGEATQSGTGGKSRRSSNGRKRSSRASGGRSRSSRSRKSGQVADTTASEQADTGSAGESAPAQSPAADTASADAETSGGAAQSDTAPQTDTAPEAESAVEARDASEPVAPAQPAMESRDDGGATAATSNGGDTGESAADDQAGADPAAGRAEPAQAEEPAAQEVAAPTGVDEVKESPRPRRRGWWRRSTG
ncbi:RNAse E [Limimonas halophila]|uniref:Ribonuclease E n=1 Tax=Limimonas halophila TaxID=1082479 RepID=A0A1G7LWT5_9PROT|nr:ribonuclease E/G [Limimonas halophila]SDF53856.1 RNAse E [Limimonas halophila]